MSIEIIPALYIGDIQGGTAVNDHGVTYVGIASIDDIDFAHVISLDEIETKALHEWLGRCLGVPQTAPHE